MREQNRIVDFMMRSWRWSIDCLLIDRMIVRYIDWFRFNDLILLILYDSHLIFNAIEWSRLMWHHMWCDYASGMMWFDWLIDRWIANDTDWTREAKPLVRGESKSPRNYYQLLPFGVCIWNLGSRILGTLCRTGWDSIERGPKPAQFYRIYPKLVPFHRTRSETGPHL